MGSYNPKHVSPASYHPEAGIQNLQLSQLEVSAKKLSKKLYIFAFFLEICVILLGVYAAVLANGSGTSGKSIFSITFVYLAIVSVAEFSKLLTSEALARYQSPALMIFATLALSISLFFTLENLLNVSSLLQHETIQNVTNANSQKHDLNNYIQNQNSKKLVLINKKQILKPLKTGSNYQNIQMEIEDIRREKSQQLKLIQDINDKNNYEEKKLHSLNIESFQSTITSLEEQQQKIQANFFQELENLEKNKLAQLENSTFYRKSSVIETFNKRIQNLESSHRFQKSKISKEIANFRNKISNAQKKILDLSSLSESNVALINEHNNKINELSNKEIELIHSRSSIAKNDDKRLDIINLEIKHIESLIDKSQNQMLALSEHINEIKNSNWLFKISSVYYMKEASLISIQELKEFSFWFIWLACVGLSLLGPILIIVSVQLEKKYSIRKDKWLWKQTLQTFKEVSGDIVKTVQAEKRYRATKKRIEDSAYELIQKNTDLNNKAIQEAKHESHKNSQQYQEEIQLLKNKEQELKNQLVSLRKKNKILEADQDAKKELALEIKNVRTEIKTLKERPTKVVKKLIPLSLLDDLKKKEGE